jgi:hypothetical protein
MFCDHYQGFPAWLIAHRENHNNQSHVYVDSHVKIMSFLYNCNKNRNMSRILVEIPDKEFYEKPYGVSCAVPRERTDGQTEGQDMHA